MKKLVLGLVLVLAVLAVTVTPGYTGGHWRGGVFIGVGPFWGWGYPWYYPPPPYYYYPPPTVVLEQPPVYVERQPAPADNPPPAPPAPPAPARGVDHPPVLRRPPAGARRQSAACATRSSRGRRVLVLLPEREGLLSERALLRRGVGEGSGAAVMKRVLPLRGVAAALVIALAVSGCATIPSGPSVMVLPGSSKNFEQFQMDD